MNKQLTKEDYLKLLELLEKDIITEVQFYKMLEIEPYELNEIINILSFNDIEDKNTLVDELLTTNCVYHKIHFVLKSYQELRNDKEKRRYIIKNSKNRNLNLIAYLIRFDSVFKDKSLLESINNLRVRGVALDSIGRNIVDIIYRRNEEFEYFEDNSKNRYISLALQLKECYINEFLKLIKRPMCIDNQKWLDYVFKCCTELEDFNIEQVKYVLMKMEENERVEEINSKIDEISQQKVKEQLKTFSTFVSNLHRISSDEIKDDKSFNYLITKIFEKEKRFISYLNYREELTSEDSLCREGTELYRKIFELDIENNVHDILESFSTSLGKFITVDLIDKIKQDEENEESNVHEDLANLAIQNNCIDYLKKYSPHDLKEKFSKSFIGYMSTYPNLTKEQLLRQKQIILETEPKFINSEYIIDIPLDESTKSETSPLKVKKMG